MQIALEGPIALGKHERRLEQNAGMGHYSKYIVSDCGDHTYYDKNHT